MDPASLMDHISAGRRCSAGTTSSPYLRGCEHVRLCPVNPNGNLRTGGAELLEEAAVRPDPQVIFSDLHLSNRGQTSTTLCRAEKPAEEHPRAAPELHPSSAMSIPKASWTPQKDQGQFPTSAFRTGTLVLGSSWTFGLLVVLRFPSHDGGE